MDSLSVDILTNIENNIKLNFFNYLRRFVNCFFKDDHEKILENLQGKEKMLKKKELARELFQLKQDLLNNTDNCEDKYDEWKKLYREKILPKEFKHSYQFDLNNDPQKYIKYMIFMNLQIEKMGGKLFQFFPLRTEIVVKYIPIDTKSLIEIFIKKNKNKYLKDISSYKEELWENYFNLKHKIFNKKNHKFDYRIITNGLSVSLQFINKDFLKEDEQKKLKMKEASIKAKKDYKNLKPKEIEELKKKKKEENDELLKSKKLEIQKKKDEFKKLSKEEKEEIIKNNKKYVEFPYLEELNETEINELRNANRVYGDPGKKNLLVLMDDEGNILRYTNKQRLVETKRLKHLKKIQNYKNRKGITETENELSNFNSKTCNLQDFMKYIVKKLQINEQLFAKYEAKIFRRYQWYFYLNKKRSEDKLLKNIKEVFGKNIIIIMGDWGIGKQMRNFISTPMIGLKRKLAEKFKVYSLDEFRTSKLNYKTESICDNLYLPDKKQRFRKIHSVLTYKMENNRLGCINRDVNSVKNMRKIVNYWLIYNKRPLKYQRQYKFDKKDSQPKMIIKINKKGQMR